MNAHANEHAPSAIQSPSPVARPIERAVPANAPTTEPTINPTPAAVYFTVALISQALPPDIRARLPRIPTPRDAEAVARYPAMLRLHRHLTDANARNRARVAAGLRQGVTPPPGLSARLLREQEALADAARDLQRAGGEIRRAAQRAADLGLIDIDSARREGLAGGPVTPLVVIVVAAFVVIGIVALLLGLNDRFFTFVTESVAVGRILTDWERTNNLRREAGLEPLPPPPNLPGVGPPDAPTVGEHIASGLGSLGWVLLAAAAVFLAARFPFGKATK